MKRKQFFVYMSISLMVLTAIGGCKKKTPPTQETSANTSQTQQPDTLPSEKFPLKLLYAGVPDTERAKDFMDFLGAHFESVTFTDYNRFSEKKSRWIQRGHPRL